MQFNNPDSAMGEIAFEAFFSWART